MNLIGLKIIVLVEHNLINFFVKFAIRPEFYSINKGNNDDMSPIREWEIIGSEEGINLRDLDQYEYEQTKWRDIQCIFETFVPFERRL